MVWTPSSLGTSPATIYSTPVYNNALNTGTLTTSACLARPLGTSRSVIPMTAPLQSRRRIGLWTRFLLELNILGRGFAPVILFSKFLHGNPPHSQSDTEAPGLWGQGVSVQTPDPLHWKEDFWASRWCNLTDGMTYSHHISEGKGPDKGPRSVPHPIFPNGANPQKRSQTEFCINHQFWAPTKQGGH